MIIKSTNELLPLSLYIIVVGLIVAFLPYNILHIILGLPLIFFIPGYTLLSALIPRRGKIDGVQRIALSFGISLAIVPIIGLILNATPWGIKLNTILITMVPVALIMIVIAAFRRRNLHEAERFSPKFNLELSALASDIRNSKLSIILVVTLIVLIGVGSYAIIKPKSGEKFTEFYILGTENTATNYPAELQVGEKGTVYVGIINHEYEIVSYRLEVRINGITNNELPYIVLENGEEWRQEVTFSPERAGLNQEVEFILHKNDEQEPLIDALRLFIDVKE